MALSHGGAGAGFRRADAAPRGAGHAGRLQPHRAGRGADRRRARRLHSQPRERHEARFGSSRHSAARESRRPAALRRPLGTKAVYALVRRDPGDGAKRLFGDVFMTSGAKTLERIVEQMPEDARFFAGLVVWLPQELEAQIEAGEWLAT